MPIIVPLPVFNIISVDYTNLLQTRMPDIFCFGKKNICVCKRRQLDKTQSTDTSLTGVIMVPGVDVDLLVIRELVRKRHVPGFLWLLGKTIILHRLWYF